MTCRSAVASGGRGLEIFLVKSAYDEAEHFGHSIYLTAYVKDAFNSGPRIF
jgi:hypothetical protein